MRSRNLLAAVVVLGHLSACAIAVKRPAEPRLTPEALARTWDTERVSPPSPPLITHRDVVMRLQAVVAERPELFSLEQIGQSVEGRSIHHLRVGSGQTPVLLWSQMHGDEPSATAALFDIFEYLDTHRDDADVRRMLKELSLHFVPMLNPDGAERFQRRNAQGIDINRDALRLQTPEGRALKALRDRINPRVGFNLHNQSWGTGIGDPPRPASISLLSVAYDKKRTENPGRVLTKKLCAVIRDSLEPFASGQIGRYDDEFEIRAFGDNLTLWGTPVVLIETGPWPAEDMDPPLVRLNFVAILSALDALATGRVNKADPRRYEELPMNASGLLYILVKNGTVITGAGIQPFVADIGISANRRVRSNDGKREIQVSMNVNDMGDLRTSGALRVIDASGLTVVPDEDYKLGASIDLPDWRGKVRAPIVIGQPPRIALLRALDDGRYRVEHLLR
jgi:hypothetical protein